MGRALARMEDSAFKILADTTPWVLSLDDDDNDSLKGKGILGRPRRSWEDNIRMDLKEMVINTRNWVDLAQDRDYWKALVKAGLNIWVSEVS